MIYSDNKIDTLSHWVVRLAYLNMLWILFCLFGGVIFGWAPATVGVFTILKKWGNKEHFSVFQVFFHVYKKEFIKSNLIGIIIISLAIGFALNLYILLQQPVTKTSSIFLVGNGTMIIMFILLLIFFFPIYVHYRGELRVVIKKIFLVTLGKLPLTIFALILSVVWITILFRFPGFFIFFSTSIPALIITMISRNWVIGGE